jgi:sec-independent protein translocase protein TatB
MGGGAAVFGIDGGEFVVLALLALFLLGPERLPGLAKQAARALHDVRRWAQRTRDDIGRELGPEFENFDLADLNPRKFVQKHLLDPLEEDDEPVAARTFGSAALASRTGAELESDGALDTVDASSGAVSLEKSSAPAHQPGHTVDLAGLRTGAESDDGVLELVGAPIGPLLTTDVFADDAPALASRRAAPLAVPVVPAWEDTASARSAADLDHAADFDHAADLDHEALHSDGLDFDPDAGFDLSGGLEIAPGLGLDAGTSVDESSSWALSYYVAPPIDLDAT